MTAEQIKTRFLIELDAVASGAAPGFTDSEISELVDKAQKDLILQLAKAKKWDDLYTLITKIGLEVDDGDYRTKSHIVDLPADYGYYINAYVKVTSTIYNGVSSNTYWANCKEISADIMDRFLPTFYNTPFFKEPVVFFSKASEALNILVDSYTTLTNGEGNLQLTYVKIPTTFSITDAHTLELPETLHDTVIAMAVEEAVKSLKTAKISTQ